MNPPRLSATALADEAVLYGAAGVALSAALLAVGGGSGSWEVGLVGAALVAAGTLVSWRTRGMRWPVRALNLGLGAGAAAGFLILVGRETAMEEGSLVGAEADVGLALALRMAVIPVALSFLLASYNVIAFCLVPALTMFGLAGGQGIGQIIIPCFAVFLPAALVAMAYGMLLSNEPSGTRAAGPRWRLRSWRTRHGTALGASIAVIGVLTYGLFFPIAIYFSQYRWHLLAQMVPRMGGMPPMLLDLGATATTFPVGRGPVSRRTTPVLSITGDPGILWRGQVFDLYTGHAWLREEEADRAPGEAGENTLDLSELFPPQPGTRLQTSVARSEVDQRLVFYSPGQIQRLRPGAGSAHLALFTPVALRVDPYGCVEAPGGDRMRRDFTYEVVSAPLEPRASVAAQPGSPPSTQLPAAYLKLPFSARRVADLARRIAADEPAPERKLAALAAHIQRSYVYTLDAPATPRGRDAADNFVFHTKRGHCDLFATTLAVMGRAVGIPTRIATGLAYPTPVEEPEAARPGSGEGGHEQRHVLRECDAHAWVEAYLPPWGWVSADATPAGSSNSPMPTYQRSLLAVRFFWQDHPSFVVGLGALAITAAAVVSLTRRRGRLGTPARALHGGDARAAIVRAYVRLLRFLRRRGRHRLPSQTPLEFLAAVTAGDGAPDLAPALPAIARLTDLFLAARYGPGPIGEDTAEAARRCLVEVGERLRAG